MMTEDERAFAKAYELGMMVSLVEIEVARLGRLIATTDLDHPTSAKLESILNGLTHARAEARQAATEEIFRQRSHKSPVPASISEHSHDTRIHPG